MTTVPLSDAQARLDQLVDEAGRTHERVTITRQGHPAVVLISADELDALEETVFWQTEAGASADVDAGRQVRASELSDEAAVRLRYRADSVE